MEQGWRVRVTIACDYPIVGASIAEVLSSDPELVVDVQSLDIRKECFTTDVLLCIADARPDIEPLLMSLKEAYKNAKLFCVFLSDDDAPVLAALRAGAVGVVDDTTKMPLRPNELIQQIKDVARGQFVMPAAMALRLARLHSDPARNEVPAKDNSLTQREQEVLSFLARGASNREIARSLALSEHTVRAHLRGIMQKLHVSNRLQAAAFAWAGKFVPDSEGDIYGNSHR